MYKYGYIITRQEQVGNGSSEYGAILCRYCAPKTWRRHPLYENELTFILQETGAIPECEDCHRSIGLSAYKRFQKDKQEERQKIQPEIDWGKYRACKTCKKAYPLAEPLASFTNTLFLAYHSVNCAINDGMDRAEAERQRQETVWSCAGCKQFFVHEKLNYRQGDFGYTALCEKCVEDPKYYCFFPFYVRQSLGMVSKEELVEDYWRQ